MSRKTLKDKPSPLIEEGLIYRNKGGELRFALVFPNTYQVAMANLGFQTVYRLFNEEEDISCERFVLEKDDKGPLKSLESGRKLKDFNLIAFSLSFENDYPNIVEILSKARIPLFSKDRSEEDPLIIAGGVVSFLNPEPVADFFDIFLTGEGEVLISPFCRLLLKYRDLKREDLFYLLTEKMEGIYIPQGYNCIRDEKGRIRELKAKKGFPEKIKRIYDPNISEKATFSPISSPNSAFPDTFLVEASRGCPHGCRFCSAGYIYRPPRFKNYEIIKKALEEGKKRKLKTGLMGTAVSDLPHLDLICREAKKGELFLSFSSLRADGLSPSLIEALVNGGVKTATIAPEAGSEKLRKVINKGLDEKIILKATRDLVEAGISNLKLYFMIGLPEEKEEDIKALKELVYKIKENFLEASRKKGYMGQITLGISPFVPKPFTPFQWLAMRDERYFKQVFKDLRKSLASIPNIRFHHESPRSSIIQGILARGDRDLSSFIVALWKNKNNLKAACREVKLEEERYLGKRSLEENLPWEIIDNLISKSFLIKEYKKAQKALSSPACPLENCQRCGVCKDA